MPQQDRFLTALSRSISNSRSSKVNVLANLGPDKMKQQTPIPPIKDEAVRKAKRAVFPYLIWGQGEGSIMSKIFPLFWLRLLPCRAGAHVHTVCETQPAVLFSCRCMSLAFSKKKKRKNARSGFEIPYYLCSREPHGLGGLALKNQPSPISFM